jgi:hypothetical protein
VDLILGLILVVVGLIALIRGRFSFSRESVALGPPARIAGAVLVAALPLAFIVNFILSALERGGTRIVPDLYGGVVTYVVMVACVIIAVIIARKGIP